MLTMMIAFILITIIDNDNNDDGIFPKGIM